MTLSSHGHQDGLFNRSTVIYKQITGTGISTKERDSANSVAERLSLTGHKWTHKLAGRVSRCGATSVIQSGTGKIITYRCERRNFCPDCAKLIRKKWANTVVDAIHSDIEQDDRILFLTFTLRHHKNQPLQYLKKVLCDALARLYRRKGFKGAIESRATCVELPYTADGGFNVHIHMLVKLSKRLELFRLSSAEIEKHMSGLWRKSTEGAGIPSWVVGVDEVEIKGCVGHSLRAYLNYFAKSNAEHGSKEHVPVSEMEQAVFSDYALATRRWRMTSTAGMWRELVSSHNRQDKAERLQRRRSNGWQRHSDIGVGRIAEMLRMDKQAESLTQQELQDWRRDYNTLWDVYSARKLAANRMPSDLFAGNQRKLLNRWIRENPLSGKMGA